MQAYTHAHARRESRVRMRPHTHTHTHTHTHKHTNTHTDTHTHTHTHTETDTQTDIHTHMHTHTHAHAPGRRDFPEQHARAEFPSPPDCRPLPLCHPRMCQYTICITTYLYDRILSNIIIILSYIIIICCAPGRSVLQAILNSSAVSSLPPLLPVATH